MCAGNKRHSKNCGCFNDAFIKHAKKNLVQILSRITAENARKSSTGPDKYNPVEIFQAEIIDLAKHHARDEHKWIQRGRNL